MEQKTLTLSDDTINAAQNIIDNLDEKDYYNPCADFVDLCDNVAAEMEDEGISIDDISEDDTDNTALVYLFDVCEQAQNVLSGIEKWDESLSDDIYAAVKDLIDTKIFVIE